ncbi:MAG TPA: hypothetical protein VFN99_11790 [Gaiella sp.]|nr:hypothetical protein [Gaiella sp.]
MKPITYSLQFRGQATEYEGGLRKYGRAPGCSLETSLTPEGIDAHYRWASDDIEALFESALVFTAAGIFVERGTIFFMRGHALRLSGRGDLAPSPDPHLRQGTVVWEVAGGEGDFLGARGRVTSNFFLSDTGDLTENQLGVVFVDRPPPAPGVGTRDVPGAAEIPSAGLSKPLNEPRSTRPTKEEP